MGNREKGREVIDGGAAVPHNEFMERLGEFDLLTLAEVAKLLHCSKAHICNAVAGRLPGCSPIPAVCLGRRKLVRRAALLSWIERNEAVNDNLNSSPERGQKRG